MIDCFLKDQARKVKIPRLTQINNFQVVFSVQETSIILGAYTYRKILNETIVSFRMFWYQYQI